MVVIKNKFEIRGEVTAIFIKRKKDNIELETIVSTEDYYNKLKNLNVSWYSVWDDDILNYYIRCTIRNGKDSSGKTKYTMLYLHRYLMDAEDGIYIDHYDHNSLNNTRENLRITKGEENAKNRKGKNKNNTTGYRNVQIDKRSGKYVVVLFVKGKIIRIKKLYDNVDEAGKDAEKYRQQYYGEFAGIG